MNARVEPVLSRPLCPAADLPPGVARGFPPEGEEAPGLFAVHGPEGIRVFLNACPHLGVPLDWRPNEFLNETGTLIICATHGATFRLDTGACLRGPCRGEALTLVPSTIVNGTLMVPAQAGRGPDSRAQESVPAETGGDAQQEEGNE